MKHKETKAFYIFGAGGHAKVVAAALQRSLNFEQCIFIDDLVTPDSKKLLNQFPIIKSRSIKAHVEMGHIAIGCNKTRKKIAAENFNVEWPPIIHPSALIHESVLIGAGSYIGAGVIINPHAKIGQHCIINTGAIIEHDCKIGDYVHIAPGSTLCGGVKVGDLTLVGAGATAIPNIEIGEECIIGAGSVVVKDIASYQKVAGNPCRSIHQ